MYQLDNRFLQSHYAKQERKIIRKSGNIIGGVILGAILLVDIIGSIAVEIMAALSEYFIFDQAKTNYVYQIIFSIILFVPPFILLARFLGFRTRDLFARKKIPFLSGTAVVAMGFAACIIINIATSYWVQMLESLGLNTEYSSIPGPDTLFDTILWIFTVSVVPAVVEEFAFRVVVLGSLRRFSDSFAIFASALLFGLVHGNLIQIPFAFLVGLVFAYITVITGSVIPAMFIHFLNNFNSCVMVLVSNNCSTLTQLLVSYAIMAAVLLFGILGMLYARKKKLLGKILYKPRCYTSSPMAFGAFCSSPLIIILSGLFLLSSLALL